MASGRAPWDQGLIVSPRAGWLSFPTMKTWNRWISLNAVSSLLLVAAPAAAQTADELAKQTQNPVASLISVPMQGNWDFGLGDQDATSTLLNVQPVMPFGISKSTNIILRVIMPLTSQPGPRDARINGLGDVVTTVFFSPAKSGRLIWGAGPVFLLPTATNNALGSEKFGLGPSVVALTQPGKWTIGILANQIWSVSGANDRNAVNTTYLQPFINYNLGDGLVDGGEHGGIGQLGGGQRHLDRADPLQRQQGDAARQTAGQLRAGRRPDHRPRCGRRLAIPPGGDVPVPTMISGSNNGQDVEER